MSLDVDLIRNRIILVDQLRYEISLVDLDIYLDLVMHKSKTKSKTI